MPQMTIYLDDDTEKLVRRAAQEAGESVSKWVADAVRRRALAEWPSDVLAILGSWDADFPEAGSLREGYGNDVTREGI